MDLTFLHLKREYFVGLDILSEFYIPVLAQALQYRRLAGFLPSTSLAVAAQGISSLIKDDGSMDLIVSPNWTRDDLATIQNSQRNAESVIELQLLEDIDRRARRKREGP